MGYIQNFQYKRQINITPSAGAGSETWSDIAVGIESAPESQSDETQTYNYMSGQGQSEIDIVGMNSSVNITGHRNVGDPAQDWIESVRWELGDARRTQYRTYDAATGRGYQVDVSVQINTWSGGGAKERSAIDITLNYNSKPVAITVTP